MEDSTGRSSTDSGVREDTEPDDDSVSDDDDDSTTGRSDPSSTTAPMGSSSSGTTTEEATDTQDTIDPACAPAPEPATPWLRDYTEQIVGPLTGATAIEPGVLLSERSTAGNRALAANFIFEAFEELGLDVEAQAYSNSGTNIVARLPATQPDARTLVVGAHYDSVPGSPGANDNATGVALVLSLARYLSEVECRTHDVLFVAFDEEEIGLIGSDAYAQSLVQQGIDVEAVHTIDQMGWDGDGDRAIELERPDDGLFSFYVAASALSDPLVTLLETQTGFTDHVSFRPYGFAAIGLTEEFVNGDTTPHYHLSSDTYETVDFDFLVSTCTLVHRAFALHIDAS